MVELRIPKKLLVIFHESNYQGVTFFGALRLVKVEVFLLNHQLGGRKQLRSSKNQLVDMLAGNYCLLLTSVVHCCFLLISIFCNIENSSLHTSAVLSVDINLYQ